MVSPPTLGVLFALFIFAADQASKTWLRLFVVPDEFSQITILPIFNIVHAWNLGASFSLFAAEGEGRRWALIAIMLIISGFVAFWLTKTTRKLPALAYGAILGGAMGNVLDRLLHGAVFDFLQFHLAGYYYPSFNLADSAIVVGVGVLLLESFRQQGEG